MRRGERYKRMKRRKKRDELTGEWEKTYKRQKERRKEILKHAERKPMRGRGKKERLMNVGE